jgi:phosphatidylglycerophosphatase C
VNLALFDFDGTITFIDTWTPFLRFAATPARMLVGRALLAPVVVGHRLGIVSSSRARAAAARVRFQGEPSAGVRQLGAEYATEVLPGMMRPVALDRIEWHKSQGDTVVVVSASLDVYLGPWCEKQGLHCICTTLEEQNGRMTGRYLEGDCSGLEKVRRIRQRYEIARFPTVYAYGDSADDRPMLELAHKKYFRWKEIS